MGVRVEVRTGVRNWSEEWEWLMQVGMKIKAKDQQAGGGKI